MNGTIRTSSVDASTGIFTSITHSSTINGVRILSGSFTVPANTTYTVTTTTADATFAIDFSLGCLKSGVTGYGGLKYAAIGYGNVIPAYTITELYRSFTGTGGISAVTKASDSHYFTVQSTDSGSYGAISCQWYLTARTNRDITVTVGP